jgi:hypothetical protein
MTRREERERFFSTFQKAEIEPSEENEAALRQVMEESIGHSLTDEQFQRERAEVVNLLHQIGWVGLALISKSEGDVFIIG